MKKIITTIAFALMSVVAFGQVDIYFEDIDKGYHIDKDFSFYSDLGEVVLDMLIDHCKSFSFYRDYKYGVPQDEFKENDFIYYEHEFLEHVCHHLWNKWARQGSVPARNAWGHYYRLYSDYRHEISLKESRIKAEKEARERAEREARTKKELEGISFSLNK